jgi:hypothetical protein
MLNFDARWRWVGFTPWILSSWEKNPWYFKQADVLEKSDFSVRRRKKLK